MSELTREEMRQRLGNIRQLQDLLFGDKMREYEQQFQECAQRLTKVESDLSQWQTNVNNRFTELENSLTKEINSAVDSLTKKLQYLNLTTHEETSKLQQAIQATAQASSQLGDSLKNQLINQTNHLQVELDHTQKTLEQEIKTLKQQVWNELETRFTELTEVKITKTALADMLFELSLKIKHNNSIAQLPETTTEKRPKELLLLEQNLEKPAENGGAPE
jgi:F0F1-type ATP synthase membrane subunit b/b'